MHPVQEIRTAQTPHNRVVEAKPTPLEVLVLVVNVLIHERRDEASVFPFTDSPIASQEKLFTGEPT